MVSDIHLTGSSRRNLITLQDIDRLAGRTEERLTSGKSVNSVLDNAVTYFRAQTLRDDAEDFNQLREGIDQGVSALEAFLDAADAVDNLLKQMKGLMESQKNATTNQRIAGTRQFEELGKQISNLIDDTKFQGTFLLNNTQASLDVRFGQRTASELIVGGYALNATSVGSTTVHTRIFSMTPFTANNSDFFLSMFVSPFTSFSAIGASNSRVSLVEDGLQRIQNGIDRLRGISAEIGINVSILQVRLDFTKKYVNDLTTANDKLVLADINEEGANLVALQTRQQLGIEALKMSGDNQQRVVRLLQ